MTQAGLSAISALAGGPLAALLPVLASTLASGRQTKRMAEALVAIDNLLKAHGSILSNITDGQYNLINETVISLFHTTCDEKIKYLRNVVNNSLEHADLTSQYSVQLSRLIRDISADEVSFLIENFRYKQIRFFAAGDASAASYKSIEDAVLYIDLGTKSGHVASGLIDLGLITQAGFDDVYSECWRFMPISAKLIALLRQ